MRRFLILLMLLFLSIPTAIGEAPSSPDPWFNPSWKYRVPITIDNTANANALSNYQVLVTVDTASLISAGKMRSDGGDIRFTDSDGTTLLSYWIESGINTATTRIWVKVPSIPASSTKTIYMYYGSTASVSSASDGASTFIMFSKSLFPVWTFSLGGHHTCVLKSDGTLWCWGNNGYGQLGDNTTTSRITPVQVVNLTNVVSIATGNAHSCALKSDGTVWCWGYNYYGQLGDGTTTNRLTPVQVSGLTNVVSIALGYYHSCALKSDGTVWCWGYNGYGQLGDNTTTDRHTPVQVVNLTNVVSIATGNAHSCALKSDGTVWCWGRNGYGQLGDGTTTNRLTPVQVSGLTNVVSIALGYYHSCALKSDGTVWCWGRNGYGQLGDGTTTNRLTPVQVVNLTNVVSIALGYYHSCALKSDGTVWCWGYNYYGQLGDNTTTDRHTPVQVVNLTNVVSIATGNAHFCALKSDGTVWCWGYNGYGQLGDGTTTNRLTPVQTLNYNLGGRYDKTNTIYSVPKYTVDDFFVRSFADPEPTTTIGSEQMIPPTISVQNFSFTYSYNGNYTVSADVCYVSTVKFYRTANETCDSYTSINSTCNRYYKTYSNLAAGTYTITVYGENTGNSVSKSFTLTINKATPSLSLVIQNGTWIQGGSITSSKNNKGDSDLVYKTFLENTYLGGVGTFAVNNKPSGIYTVVFNTTEGQNWTSSSITKKLEIYKAWEKTDSIYSNKSYRYDYDKSAVPVAAYFKYKSANSTAYVNKYLYVYSLTNVTNNDTILQQTFTNVVVNVSAPSGFILLNSSYSIPSLAYGEVHQANVYARAVCVYEKVKSLNTGHATYTLTVNSSFVSELPVVYQLSAPPDWDKRTSYSITVDGKTTGFTFDPNTLTLNISTSFSHSSLEPGDHIIDLQYLLPSPPPSGPVSGTGGAQPSNVSTAPSGAPSGSQVEVVNPPPQNVISTPAPVSGIFQIFGIPFPLKYVFIALMVIICVLLILVPRRKRRKATWLK